jgi:hypothetical protein
MMMAHFRRDNYMDSLGRLASVPRGPSEPSGVLAMKPPMHVMRKRSAARTLIKNVSKDSELVGSHYGETPDEGKQATTGSATPYTTSVDVNP